MEKIYKFGKRSLNNLKGIHPILVQLMMQAITHSPYDFTITDGLRTTEMQQKLYAKGRTTEGKVVTNADGVKNKSNHQAKDDGYGYAVDLYPYIDGSVRLNALPELKEIAQHIKKVAEEMDIKISWGGDWNLKGKMKKDYPHFELKLD